MSDTKRGRLLAAAIVATYIALALLLAVAVRPRADEGFFASPALNLVQTGSMGTPVIEPGHAFMKDIARYTYWITPLDFLAQAAWYTVFGFSLLTMRTLSILWALAALGAWYLILRRISRNGSLALFGVALIGLDYNFIVGGSSGRMDMMAASLGFCAIAAYLVLRERNLGAAVVTSNALVCAAGLTHPVAGYLYFSAIVFLTLYYDRKRIRLNHVALAVLPYLIGAAGWGSYILKDPEAFRAQFTNNATMSGRLSGLSAPWTGFVREWDLRYLKAFGVGRDSLVYSGPVYLKALILAAFLVGLAGAIATRGIRGDKGFRALMFLALIFFVLLSVLDGQKAYYYLIHVFPFYAALSAAWVHGIWQRRPALRPLLATAVSGVLALQIGAAVLNAARFTYARTYEPAIAFLKEKALPGRTIMGSASLGFGLNFAPNLVDDVRLGYLTGRTPDYIVVNEEYSTVFRNYAISDPRIRTFIDARLKEEYDCVYDKAGFRVYENRLASGAYAQHQPAAPAPTTRP